MKKTVIFMMLLMLLLVSVGGTVLADEEVEALIPFHVSMDHFPAGMDINDNTIINKAREISGLDIKLESLPKSEPMQKVILKLASGDVPDLMYVADFFKLANQGLFSPVGDLMAEYAPNYIEKVPADIRNSLSLDGKTYGIAVYFYRWFKLSLVAREDVLADLGLEAPETLDEYYQVFKAIKENTDMVPLTFDANQAGVFFEEVAAFAGAYGLANPTTIKDGKVVFSWTQPEYKEFVKYMKKLYDEKLLDTEFAINKYGTTKNKIASGQYAMGIVPWYHPKGINSSLETIDSKAKIKYYPTPKGPDGEYGVIDYPATKFIIAIPAMAENKEGAAKLVNFLYSDDFSNLVAYGIEGEHYNKEDGEIVLTDKFEEVKPYMTYLDIRPSLKIKERVWKIKGNLTYIDQLKATTKPQKNIMFTAPLISEYENNIVALRNFAYENTLKFIMGTRPLSEFDNYVKEFNNRGGEEIMEVVNEWYLNK